MCRASRASPSLGRASSTSVLGSPRPAGRAGPVDVVDRGLGVRRVGRPRRAADQPGVRLGEPDRPAAPWWRALGCGRRLAGQSRSQAQGASVSREYYFNDHGAQIDRFARSLLASAKGEPAPEDGYGGDYIAEIAQQVLTIEPAALGSAGRRGAQEIFRREGVELMFDEIKASLHSFGVDFDVYFHENDLHDSGAVDRAIVRLREQGHIFEADGAIWLRTTEFGDDKDRVVIKSDGEPAYISGDAAYYLDKRERGFDKVVIMLGADHHGYIGRLMAMCACFGDTPGVNLEILIGQLVNLVKDGQPVRMSKRAGTVVTLEDLVEAVGVDAARYALARSSADSQIDIDLDLLTRHTNDNPVYYVQYAHARTAGVDPAGDGRRRPDSRTASHPSLLTHMRPRAAAR